MAAQVCMGSYLAATSVQRRLLSPDFPGCQILPNGHLDSFCIDCMKSIEYRSPSKMNGNAEAGAR